MRAAWIFAATSLVAVAAAIWLYLDNRALRATLATREHAAAATVTAAPAVIQPSARVEPSPAAGSGAPSLGTGPVPQLAPPKDESRFDRRQRRQAEFAAKFGRIEGETDEEYRARVMPLIATGLALPRMQLEQARKDMEAKAGVTAEQSKQLDAAFDKTYADALDYTNKAIADGILSPYERNVGGWLEFAGGLGGILNETNGQIGQILSPQQVQTISSSGFEWGEYLGAKAPWEKLTPPPPPHQ